MQFAHVFDASPLAIIAKAGVEVLTGAIRIGLALVDYRRGIGASALRADNTACVRAGAAVATVLGREGFTGLIGAIVVRARSAVSLIKSNAAATGT